MDDTEPEPSNDVLYNFLDYNIKVLEQFNDLSQSENASQHPPTFKQEESKQDDVDSGPQEDHRQNIQSHGGAFGSSSNTGQWTMPQSDKQDKDEHKRF